MVDHTHELSAEDAKEAHRLLSILYQREPSAERYRLLTKVFFYAKARGDECQVCVLEAENAKLKRVRDAAQEYDDNALMTYHNYSAPHRKKLRDALKEVDDASNKRK